MTPYRTPVTPVSSPPTSLLRRGIASLPLPTRWAWGRKARDGHWCPDMQCTSPKHPGHTATCFPGTWFECTFDVCPQHVHGWKTARCEDHGPHVVPLRWTGSKRLRTARWIGVGLNLFALAIRVLLRQWWMVALIVAWTVGCFAIWIWNDNAKES